MNVFLERREDELTLIASPRDKDLVTRIPGAHHDGQVWAFPLSWATCVAAREVFGDRLVVGPAAAEWSWAEHGLNGDLKIIKHGEVFPDEEVGDLYPFQLTGVRWMEQGRQVLLTDEMGLGKTVQVLSALDPADFPVLIVCTNSMKHTWAAEWEKWGPPHGGIVVVGGTAAQRRKQLAQDASVFIINWEAVRLHSRVAPYGSIALTDAEKTPKELNEIGFRTVIADEVHRAADPKSKQTRGWWSVSHGAQVRIGLTGTPVVNRPSDLWSIMHGIRPQDFPRKSKFVDRFCHAGVNMHGIWEVWGLKEERKAELFSFLDPRMLRRTKAEVLPQLPAKTYSTRYVDMEGRQLKAYRALEKEMIANVDGEYLVADSPLTLAGRLVQIAAGTPVLGELTRRDPTTGADYTVTGVVALSAPSCKVDALLEILEEAPGEPLVVFAASRKLITLCAEVLEKKGISTVLLTGEVSPAARTQRVVLFQEGEAQVALCTTGAASEGITLTRASRAVFLQRDWSNVKNKQAEDRIHRIGQDADKVEIIDVITADSIEADVHEAGEMKEGFLQEIVRDRLRA